MKTKAELSPWCEHVTVSESMGHEWFYWFDVEIVDAQYIGSVNVDDKWQFCPICGKPRPK